MISRIRHWLESIRFLNIGNFIYWVRSRFFNKYHLIDITGMDNYKWGWIDRDRVILLAMFKIFIDFVEQELECKFVLENEFTDHEDPGYQYWVEEIPGQIEILYLYNWWKTERKQQHELDDKMLTESYKDMDLFIDSTKINLAGNEELKLLRDIHMCYSQELDDLDQRNLHKLIDLRERLWT